MVVDRLQAKDVQLSYCKQHKQWWVLNCPDCMADDVEKDYKGAIATLTARLEAGHDVVNKMGQRLEAAEKERAEAVGHLQKVTDWIDGMAVYLSVHGFTTPAPDLLAAVEYLKAQQRPVGKGGVGEENG